MRDYRDAKAMAHTLRDALASKDYKISVGESLELIAHLFGVADWNTLSALIKNAETTQDTTGKRRKAGHVQFAPTTEEALHRALGTAVERGQREATVEHLLLSLTRDPDVMAIMKAREVELSSFRNLIARSIDLHCESDGGGGGVDPKPSPAFQRVVQHAILDVQGAGGGSVTGANLLAAIFLDEESTAAQMLRERGIDRSDAVKATRHRTG
jgi:hypothetical protein